MGTLLPRVSGCRRWLLSFGEQRPRVARNTGLACSKEKPSTKEKVWKSLLSLSRTVNVLFLRLATAGLATTLRIHTDRAVVAHRFTAVLGVRSSASKGQYCASAEDTLCLSPDLQFLTQSHLFGKLAPVSDGFNRDKLADEAPVGNSHCLDVAQTSLHSRLWLSTLESFLMLPLVIVLTSKLKPNG